MENDNKPLVVMAGASGFVGTHLRRALLDRFRIRALTRSDRTADTGNSDLDTEWKRCDLYSLPKVAEAMKGGNIGVYLVHSMAPSSRLVQASFEDTDLLLADNFIRAAEEAGLSHVIYLGGLMPDGDVDVSPHLRSRQEVEEVLRSSTVKVTVLRAGLIFGPGGSSFSMLIHLVRRLPVMLFPAWTRSTTQSIDIRNVCQAFQHCLLGGDLKGGCYDLGGHQPMTYRSLILRTGTLLGKRIRSLDVPGNFFGLSKRWVAVFGGVPMALVGPLLESLRHDLRARPNPLLERMQSGLFSLEESLENATDEHGKPRANPRKETRSSDARTIKREKRVLSVQRMSLSTDVNAIQVSREYGEWLTRVFRGVIRVEQNSDETIRFLAFGRIHLLELSPSPYTIADNRRCSFYITGGVLSRDVEPQGRLEFRLFPHNNCLIASIHGFAPTLPWWIYRWTQAVAHLLVMKAFGRHLSRLGRIEAEEP